MKFLSGIRIFGKAVAEMFERNDGTKVLFEDNPALDSLHVHNNREVIDGLSDIDDSLYYKGSSLKPNLEYATIVISRTTPDPQQFQFWKELI
jgi:hypothetical protein